MIAIAEFRRTSKLEEKLLTWEKILTKSIYLPCASRWQPRLTLLFCIKTKHSTFVFLDLLSECSTTNDDEHDEDRPNNDPYENEAEEDFDEDFEDEDFDDYVNMKYDNKFSKSSNRLHTNNSFSKQMNLAKTKGNADMKE